MKPKTARGQSLLSQVQEVFPGRWRVEKHQKNTVFLKLRTEASFLVTIYISREKLGRGYGVTVASTLNATEPLAYGHLRILDQRAYGPMRKIIAKAADKHVREVVRQGILEKDFYEEITSLLSL